MPDLSPSSSRFRHGAPAYWLLLSLVAIVALAGGTSRYDSFGSVIVCGAATIAMIGWILIPGADLGTRDRAGLRLPLIFLGLVAAVILIQLIPLPPAMWTLATDREFYTGTAAATGGAQPWRPINLSPERGWASFFALLVPLATLVGLSRCSERRRLTLVLPMLVLVMASAVLGLAQLSGGKFSVLRWYSSSDPFANGFFANRNHQALLLSIALPLLAVWALERTERQRGRRYRPAIAVGTGMFLLLMIPTTGSRAGFVTGLLGLLGALAIAAPAGIAAIRAMSRRRRRTTLSVAAGMIAIFAVIAVVFGRNDSLHRFQGLDATQDLRARTLPTVIDIARHFFPFGSGVGSFDPVYRRFEPFDMLSTSYLNLAHNDLIQVVLEAGLAGALLLAVMAVWLLVRGIAVWRAPTSSAVRTGRAGSVVIVMILAASTVDYPVRTSLMMMVLTIAAVWLEQGGRSTAVPLVAPPAG